ncbi:MAG: nicotinate-nucleotide--dimethylbenzimidazole phosphoribosyltransferase [Candidatus Thiodiazotropha sp.]
MNIPYVEAVSSEYAIRAKRLMDEKTKPIGALGYVEEVACQLAAIQQTIFPSVDTGIAIVFVADHGVAEEGVSAYPTVVTKQMAENFAHGGAAMNIITKSVGLELEIVDVGINSSDIHFDGVLNRRIRQGTRNIAIEPALTIEECSTAFQVGVERINNAANNGFRCIVLGEMGIGNSTSAAALISSLCHKQPKQTVGPGTGVFGPALENKVSVVKKALNRACNEDLWSILANLGGLEICALAGAMVAGAAKRIPIIVDGLIASSAALWACRLEPKVRDYLFFGHQSPEPGHAIALQELNATPLLRLDMRLGEGTGAALAYPILLAATRILTQMASFKSAGVSRSDLMDEVQYTANGIPE